MPNILRKLKIREVSSVDKGAGLGVAILIAKRDGADEQNWALNFEITKMDADKQQIFGWASVATIDGQPVVDRQGDVIPVDELEKAAYDFLLDGGTMGDMHERVGVGRPIESMVFTKAKCDALGIEMNREGWFVGFQIDSPEVWAAHKRGERPDFSIGGSAVREPTAKRAADPTAMAMTGDWLEKQAVSILSDARFSDDAVTELLNAVTKSAMELAVQYGASGKDASEMCQAALKRVLNSNSNKQERRIMKYQTANEALVDLEKYVKECALPHEHISRTYDRLMRGDDQFQKMWKEVRSLPEDVAKAGIRKSKVEFTVSKRTSAFDKMEKLAAELRKSERGLTMEQAFAKIYEANPELVQMHKRELRGAV